MNTLLKILLLEDSADDAALIQRELTHGGIRFSSLIVETKSAFTDAIHHFKPDLVLSDHSMPDFNSAEALSIYKSHQQAERYHAPFILVTGAVSEEFAVQCIRNGADDYILKDRLQRLPAAIRNALEKCRVENINEQSNAEKLLLLERYEFVTKATSEAIWDWDIVNNTTFCGHGFEKIFGHHPATQDTLLQNFNTAYISADDIERVVTSIELAIQGTDQNWTEEYRYLKGNGDYAFVQDHAIIIRNEQGVATRMIGAMKDITTKKTEDLRLKLLESVITNTTDAVLLAEVDHAHKASLKIVYVNEAFTTMTGYTNEEVLGKSPRLLQGKNSALAEMEKLKVALEENESCQVEIISYKKNGEEFWLHFSATPIAGADGLFTHWVFIERDITEQRERIKSIENQNLKLKEIAWLQSHVVRAPLARMMGFINLINSEAVDAPPKEELLPYVLNAARELDGIIRDIVTKSEMLTQNNNE